MAEASEQLDGQTTGRKSLADLVREAPPAAAPRRLTRETWVKIGVLTAAFVAANHWQLELLVDIWRHDPDWSHGFLIPLFSLYLLYSRRHALRAAPVRVCLWGLGLLVVGIAASIVAYYPVRVLWFSNLAMVLALGGLVLYLTGPAVLRVAWLPVAFLAFAMPLPERLYGAISLPMQNFAAQGAATLLQWAGVELDVRASHLSVVSLSGRVHELTVAEACSGMRLLMAFLALGVAMAYLENRPNWQRIVLVLMGIPVAVFTNVLRVSVTCSAFVFDKPAFGQKFMHEFTGMIMLGPALLMLWLLGWLLQGLFVEDEEAEAAEEVAS